MEAFDVYVLLALALLLIAAISFVRLGNSGEPLREVGLAVIGGVIVGMAVFVLQLSVEDELNDLAGRAKQQTELEVRQAVSAADDGGSGGDGPADLAGQDLRDLDLSSIDLDNGDLEAADLEDADLSDSSLEEANLEGANLEDATLTDSDLSGADLVNADLEGADLEGADLRDVDLTGADLTSADLSGADLTGADLTGAIVSPDVLAGAELENTICPDGTVTDTACRP